MATRRSDRATPGCLLPSPEDTLTSGRRWRQLVEPFAGLEHPKELFKPPLPSFRLLGVMKPVQNGVSVLAVELPESTPSTRVVS
jgi:hypothetical protein